MVICTTSHLLFSHLQKYLQIKSKIKTSDYYFFNTKTSELDTAVTDSLMNSHLFFFRYKWLTLNKRLKEFHESVIFQMYNITGLLLYGHYEFQSKFNLNYVESLCRFFKVAANLQCRMKSNKFPIRETYC